MAHLSLTLLGPLRVTLDGAAVTAFRSDKVRALLAYLALEPDRPHRREALAGLLWPGYPEPSARQSLSQALLDLRRTLGKRAEALLTATRATVQWNGAACSTDALTFSTLLEACRAHAHAHALMCPDCAARLLQAVDLYTGDLLAGFSLPDSPEFEEWLVIARERFRRVAGEALRALTARAEAADDSPAGLAHARRWVELDPLSEEAQRALMRLLALSGDRSAALAAFEGHRATLRRELRVEPEAETTALYEEIRQGRLRGVPRSVPEPSRASGRAAPLPLFLTGEDRFQRPAFVAREAELAQLSSHLSAVLSGQPRVIFVSGEPGSGKTALLDEFCRRAMARYPNLVVAAGHCDAAVGAGDPYLAFREILAQWTGDVEARYRAGAMGREQASRLWALAPEACHALEEVAPDLVGTLVSGGPLLERAALAAGDAPWVEALRPLVQAPRAAREILQPALFAQFADLVERLARRHSLLLILEDLHWADTGSAGLLFHLGTRLAGEPVLVVGAYRPSDVMLGRGVPGGPPERHPLEPVLHELQRRQGETVLDLDRAEARAFVDALLDSEPNALDEPFRDALCRQAGGNPLFTVELLGAMRERGALVLDDTGRWAAGAVDWGALPARVEGVIAQRLGALGPLEREALRAASVEGEVFTAEAVARVVGLPPGDLVRRLGGEADRRHHLVVAVESRQAVGATLSRYRFRHILVQAHLYNALDPVERAYLHRAIGEALEALHGEDDEVAVHLAHHYEQAGDFDRAVMHLQRAGDRAARLSAHHEAATLYGRGLEHLAALPAGPTRDQRELALQLALGASLQAHRGYSAPEVERAALRVSALLGQSGNASQAIRALALLDPYYVTRGDLRAGLEAAERAASVARRVDDPLLAAISGVLLGWVHANAGDFRQALVDLEPIGRLYDGGELEHAEGWLASWATQGLVYLMNTLAFLGYPDRSLLRRADAIRLARSLGGAMDVCSVLAAAASYTYKFRRDYAGGRALAEQALALARRSQLRHVQAVSTMHLGATRAHLGELAEGVRDMERSLEMGRELGLRYNVATVHCYLAEAFALAGRVTEGLEAVSRGLQAAEETGGALQYRIELHRLRGALLLQRDGDAASDAAGEMLAAMHLARDAGGRWQELRAAASLGRLWQRQGQGAEARALVQPIYAWFTEGFDLPDLVEARALLDA